MPSILIQPTTAAVTSLPFSVTAGQGPRGISCWGLTGSDTVTIYRDRGDGTFYALANFESVLTVGKLETSIVASGRYLLFKGITTGSVGASID
jgi:hypothetical protein